MEATVPVPNEALVTVAAIWLNAGESRRAMAAAAGWRPGWDLVGTVIEPVANGSGPAAGTRVVGILSTEAWAEVVAVRDDGLAELPIEAGSAEAATLPITGLTALRALQKAGGLLGRRMLITAASGDAGYFACRRAQRAGAQWAGARVVGTVRRTERAAAARDAGAHEVVLDNQLATQGAALRPFDLIVEAVGAGTLTAALKLPMPLGVCVTLGATAGTEIAFEMRECFELGGVALLGFHAVRDMEAGRPPGPDLARLAQLVAEGHRRAPVEVEAPWTEIVEQAQALLERRLTGQAVLWVDG